MNHALYFLLTGMQLMACAYAGLAPHGITPTWKTKALAFAPLALGLLALLALFWRKLFAQ
jgi:hypothetical protein